MKSAINRYHHIIESLLNKNELSFDEELRLKRHRFWIELAESSLRGQDSTSICQRWSESADETLKQAFTKFFDINNYALLALGKLGSHELNLSSDVDILIIQIQEASDDWRPALRSFQNTIGNNTQHGFCHRVDFDLRPGGRMSQTIPTLEQFEDYYGNYGETWERVALLRSRIIVCPESHKNSLQNFINKFVWRRHLDFSLMDDLKKLRSSIKSQVYEKNLSKDEFNLKFAPGGIRDIELFVHSLLMIHGGREKNLRTTTIPLAINDLKKFNLMVSKDADFLSQLYVDLRRLENYVQAIGDQQTHVINIGGPHPDWAQDLINSIEQRTQRSSQIVSEIIGSTNDSSSNEISLTLKEEAQHEIIAEIINTPVLSRNRARDEEQKKQFVNSFIHQVKNINGNLDRCLIYLKDFIKKTRAKSSFYDLFLHNSTLLEEFVWLFAHSPYLAHILIERPELLDSFIHNVETPSSDSLESLLVNLFERKQINEIAAGAEFLRTQNLNKVLESCTNIADSTVERLTTFLKKEIPSEVIIEPLGKWGGGELGLRSDLDFVFYSPVQSSEVDFKYARRVINRLTEAQNGGHIFAIDMRLRPNGKGGPLISTSEGIQEWLTKDASIWERQAWLKSKNFQKYCTLRPLEKSELLELKNIQQELISTHQPSPDHYDLKYSTGGLLEIELFLQTVLLSERITPRGTSTFDFFDNLMLHSNCLKRHYYRMRQLEQMMQLTSAHSITILGQNHECLPRVAEALQLSEKVLISELKELFFETSNELNKLDPRRSAQ